jgi:hypothetical protein
MNSYWLSPETEAQEPARRQPGSRRAHLTVQQAVTRRAQPSAFSTHSGRVWPWLYTITQVLLPFPWAVLETQWMLVCVEHATSRAVVQLPEALLCGVVDWSWLSDLYLRHQHALHLHNLTSCQQHPIATSHCIWVRLGWSKQRTASSCLFIYKFMHRQGGLRVGCTCQAGCWAVEQA